MKFILPIVTLLLLPCVAEAGRHHRAAIAVVQAPVVVAAAPGVVITAPTCTTGNCAVITAPVDVYRRAPLRSWHYNHRARKAARQAARGCCH